MYHEALRSELSPPPQRHHGALAKATAIRRAARGEANVQRLASLDEAPVAAPSARTYDLVDLLRRRAQARRAA
jgi:hypothetical protein